MGFFENLFGKKVPPPPPVPEISIEQVKGILRPFRRTAYLPVTTDSVHTFSAKSKMGGYPYLRNPSDWPVCPHCGNHLQLFLQLDMASLPERKSNGLVQFFYCTNADKECDVEQDGWEPFSDNSVCRKIEASGDSAIIEPKISEVFPEKVITGWTAVEDYPSPEEYGDLRIALDISDGALYRLLEDEKLTPVAGEKLFGWPYWVQDVEYPFDPQTGALMDLLFQIDSDGYLPFMFGDSGVGHLTQSPDDENVLAFGWACC